MIKIAFLIRSLGYGGAERQLVTLAKGLDRKRFDVTVLHFYSDGPLAEVLKESGIKTISLKKRGRWDLFGFLLRFVRHIKLIRADVIHGYLGTSNLLILLCKSFSPQTRMIWGVRASNVDLSRYDWLPRLTFQVERLFSRFADLIIVNSNAGQAHCLAHGFLAERMVVISNGIDAERFKPDREAGARLRAEWGVSEKTILIGLVGRLDPMKDHATFLRAAALMCEGRYDVRFVCVGGGPESYRQEMQQLTRELGISENVVWPGVRADISAIHNALDIASSSSAYGEGFPNVIGEAMACGVPCVVTDVGDSALIVGDTGVVVAPQDPEALAAGWVSCLQKDRTAMGMKARLRITENFSVPRLVEQTQAAILRIFNSDEVFGG